MAEGTKIFEAIPKIMGELEAIARDKRGDGLRYQYRGIDDIYNALAPLMAKYGVFTAPEVLKEERFERQSKSGGAITHTILHIRYRFFASDGSFFDTVLIGESMDSGDKSANKAESAAHKYALTQVFAIRTQDVEADATQPPEIKARVEKVIAKPVGVGANITPSLTAPVPPTATVTPHNPSPAAASGTIHNSPTHHTGTPATRPTLAQAAAEATIAGIGKPMPTETGVSYIGAKQRSTIFEAIGIAGVTEEELREYLDRNFHIKNTSSLTTVQYQRLMLYLNGIVDNKLAKEKAQA